MKRLLLLLLFPSIALAEPRVDRRGEPLPDGAIARFGTLRGRLDENFIQAAVLSPDGKIIAVETEQSITFRDLDTGRIFSRREYEHPSVHAPMSRAISPDGKYYVHADLGYYTVYELATGKKLHANCHSDRSGPVVFYPDSNCFAFVSGDGRQPIVVDAATGIEKPLRMYRPTVRLSSSGRYFIGAVGDSAYLLNAKTGKVRARFSIPEIDETLHLPFELTPDDRLFCLLDAEGRLRIYDAETGEPRENLDPPVGSIETYDARTCLSPDGSVFYAHHRERISRRDLKNRRWLPTLLGVPDGFMLPHPDGKRLFVATHSGLLLKYDVATGRLLNDPLIFLAPPHVSASPDGRRVAATSGFYSGRLDVLELDGRVIWSVEQPQRLGVARWSADGRRIAVAGGKEALVCDAATGKVLQRFTSPEADLTFSGFVAFDGGDLLASLNRGGAIARYDGATGKSRGLIRQEEGELSDWSPTTRSFAFDNGSPWPALLDAETGRFRVGFSQPPPPRGGCWGGGFSEHDYSKHHFSPDGDYLVTFSHGYMLYFETATMELLRAVLMVDRHAVHFGFSPDGLCLATSNGDDVTLWDVPSGEELVTWKCPSSITSLTFAGRGRLVTGHEDMTALVWDMRPKKPLTQPAWDALRGPDALEAYRAVWALSDDPGAADWLRRQIGPAKQIEPERMKLLLANLDAGRYAKREIASKELQALGMLVEPELRDARNKASAEVGMRIDDLLARMCRDRNEVEVIHASAIAAMELSPDQSARDLLRHWAAGTPGARLTIDAKAALARLK